MAQQDLRAMVDQAVQEVSDELGMDYLEDNYKNLLAFKLNLRPTLTASTEVAFTMYSREQCKLGTCRADIVVQRWGVRVIEGEVERFVVEGMVLELKAGVSSQSEKNKRQIRKYLRHYPEPYQGLLIYFAVGSIPFVTIDVPQFYQ